MSNFIVDRRGEMLANLLQELTGFTSDAWKLLNNNFGVVILQEDDSPHLRYKEQPLILQLSYLVLDILAQETSSQYFLSQYHSETC